MARPYAPAIVLLLPLALGAQAPTLSVSGVGYLHYSYELGVDSSLGPGAHGNNFDVDRTYVTIAARLSNGFSSRVTTDVDPGRSSSNQLVLRLKYAYLAWHPEGSPYTVKIGEIQTPLIDWEEALWGYRMQGTVPMDRAGYLTSSDFGLSVDGSWADDRVNATAGVYDGEGYSRSPGDQHKDGAVRLSVRLARSDVGGRTGGLRLTGLAHYGVATGGGTRSRYLALVSWQSTALTLGAEYAVTRDSTAPASPHTSGRVVSAYGAWSIPATPAALLARVDSWDPDVDVTLPVPDMATDRRTRVITGVAYRVTPEVRMMLDADLLSLAHGSPDNAFDARRRTMLFQTEFRF